MSERGEYGLRRPEALFSPTMTRPEKERVFYDNYPPETTRGTQIVFLPQRENLADEQWRFGSYNTLSGEVLTYIGNEQGITDWDKLGLVDYYLYNPDQAPPDLKLPLDMYVNAWEKFSRLDSGSIFDPQDPDYPTDEIFEYIQQQPATQDRLMSTLMTPLEARRWWQQLFAKCDQLRRVPEKETPDQQYDRRRRNTMFGIEEESRN